MPVFVKCSGLGWGHNLVNPERVRSYGNRRRLRLLPLGMDRLRMESQDRDRRSSLGSSSAPFSCDAALHLEREL
jgi:hypothetical protein